MTRSSPAAKPRPRLLRAALRSAPFVALPLVALLASLTLVALAVQAAADTVARLRATPSGVLVDVGGHRLHLACAGQGSPTVVLEYGILAHSLQWGWIQPAVARTTRVCAYDRAGYGLSDSGPGPRTAGVEADELHVLLGRAGVPGPYVLVGQSYGALVVRAFAAKHLQDVAGVVFVDATHPSQFDQARCAPTCLPAAIQDDVDPAYRLAPVLARLGGFRLFHLFLRDRAGLFDWVKTLPAESRPTLIEELTSTRHWATGVEEWRSFAASADQARALSSIGDRPLRVVTAGATALEGRTFLPPGLDGRRVLEAWNRLQADLLRLSSASAQILVPEATDLSLATEQAHARRVVQAIGEVVAAARAKGSGTS